MIKYLTLFTVCIVFVDCSRTVVVKTITGQMIKEEQIVQLLNESNEAIKRKEPIAMRETLDRIEKVLDQALPYSKDDMEVQSIIEQLEDSVDCLRQALQDEIVTRMREAHKMAIQQKDLKKAMKEWQVGSFYLGLLPEAITAEEASMYQEYLTEHEQIRDKIAMMAKINYSRWAVEQMKIYVTAFDKAKHWYGDSEKAMVKAAIKFLGPIETSLLTIESFDLYRSLLQDTFEQLDKKDRSLMVEGMEISEKTGMLDLFEEDVEDEIEERTEETEEASDEQPAETAEGEVNKKETKEEVKNE